MKEKKEFLQEKILQKLLVKRSIKEYPISFDGKCNVCKDYLHFKCVTISGIIESEAFICVNCLEIYSVPLIY